MAVIKCVNNHFYDNGKFQECPHCKRAAETGQTPEPQGRTVAKFASPLPAQKLTERFGADTDEGAGKTQSLYFKNNNGNPVSGWLVCCEGDNRGRSYEVHVGKNFAGRSMRSDIVINDLKISRENHFTIVYDPNSSEFFLVNGSSLVYINGRLLEQAQGLKEGDVIEAGDSKFVFVPYCREGRNWND